MTGRPVLDPDTTLLRVLTGSTDYAVVLVDLDGVITGWTGAASRLFGHSAGEAIGRHYGLLFVEEDLALHLHVAEMDVARASGRSEDDRWHLSKDGGRFWGSGVLQAVFDDEGGLRGYCKMVRDRTDWHSRTSALENEVERQAGDIQRRTEFIVAMVHELRNPLSPISAATDLLDRIADPSMTRKAVEVLKRQIAILARHLDDLYEASHAAVGKLSLKIEPVVANTAVSAVAQDAATLAERRQIDLRVVVPASDIVIEADPQRVQQMLQNLLSNAIKYTPPGGKVVVSATVEGSSVAIRVEDTGVGIALEMLPRIFELFTREENRAGAASPEGLGVGLAMVKSLADLHGGSVEARSLGRNRGSVFALRLPLKQPPSAVARRQQDAD